MNTYYKLAKKFVDEAPYKQAPYGSRNWGDKWHSLCSYHGKLKPSIAHFLVQYFSKPGEVVLDPLCGVGTIPFEACLQNRIGIGNDLSELAYCVTKAKISIPEYEDVIIVLNRLKKYINRKRTFFEDNELPYKDFGLNKTLIDYFHVDTYKEILITRQYFSKKIKRLTSPEAVVYSCVLHILHGNRPYALSRQSHPLTPYAPSGDFTYKNLINYTKKKIDIMYKSLPNSISQGVAIHKNCFDLNDIHSDIIITSPPFADSMRFYNQNWMRLWFCGWEPEDFKLAADKFIDDKQNKDLDLYYDFFRKCDSLLKSKGKLILHLGETKKLNMAEELIKRSSQYFKFIYLGTEDVSNMEKHGFKDKGATIAHQFLFLEKKE